MCTIIPEGRRLGRGIIFPLMMIVVQGGWYYDQNMLSQCVESTTGRRLHLKIVTVNKVLTIFVVVEEL